MDYLQVANDAVTKYGAMQKVSELAALLELLDAHEIGSALEIGGNYGGTLWAWRHICSGSLACVDLEVLEGKLEHAGDDVVRFCADSTDPLTIQAVREEFPDGFDFVFIDGDHRYGAVRLDAKNWYPLVRPGGVIAFHDICHRYIGQLDNYHDMWKFWTMFSHNKPHLAIYDPDPDPEQDWGGIGVIFVPPVTLPQKLPRLVERRVTRPAQTIPPNCTECRIQLVPGEDILCKDCAA